LDPGLPGLVGENRHRDRLDVLREVPAKRIAAAGDGGGEQAERDRAAHSPHARVTMLTRRLGTTTTFSTRRCPIHGPTRSSPRANCPIPSSAVSPSTTSRPRTLPWPWTTTVPSVFCSAVGFASGQHCRKRLSE